ncbi:alpha/beta hydrolase domain-containing protein [Gordonia rhizosphera]|uniref:Alpha/beta hydrolase domain-containing protein n=1 Tax=Gordonia rhizosphera NBRC 16068 TaxID=1108045 RepID=K6VSI2_9ACTN|nr:alpha/beta hydrolase domain-containing protein [Gordonia rhizosphera]GAB89835.1 hypothetical protein GORHZ_072_00110 [Gordonia rhizosphera NBRC 16068]
MSRGTITRRVRGGVIAGLMLVFALMTCATAAYADVPAPKLTEITHGIKPRPWTGMPFDPIRFGYTQTEYLISGTARAFGRQALPPSPYTARMMVYRPRDPARFSGDVVVEWSNASLQLDLSPEFSWLRAQTMRNGDAYVVVTSQQASACGWFLAGQPMIRLGDLTVAPCTPISMKGYDPVRYGGMYLPGVAYSFDIFSQAGRALRNASVGGPLGGLKPKHLIAIGISQSAMALDNYISFGADDAARIYDGIIIDSDIAQQLPERYRVPTLHIWSEESARSTSPQGPNHRTWSVAGAPHIDTFSWLTTVDGIARNTSSRPLQTAAQTLATERRLSEYGQSGPSGSASCLISSQFQRRYVVDAGLSAMQKWLTTGVAPKPTPPLKLNPLGQSAADSPVKIATPIFVGGGPDIVRFLTAPIALAKDGHGNALGGMRLPQIAVPVARYDGALCMLFGTTVALEPAELARLYPTHQVYVDKMLAATQASIADGFLTPYDGREQMRMACDSAIPRWGFTPPEAQPALCRDIGAALS